ncbi:hypothetical protein P9139_05285 [Curtobacterium flaccumfaciens]|nr:hypothetical protein P9139_05285 [Curtobacterium flaccumfaciens]
MPAGVFGPTSGRVDAPSDGPEMITVCTTSSPTISTTLPSGRSQMRAFGFAHPNG